MGLQLPLVKVAWTWELCVRMTQLQLGLLYNITGTPTIKRASPLPIEDVAETQIDLTPSQIVNKDVVSQKYI